MATHLQLNGYSLNGRYIWTAVAQKFQLSSDRLLQFQNLCIKLRISVHFGAHFSRVDWRHLSNRIRDWCWCAVGCIEESL